MLSELDIYCFCQVFQSIGSKFLYYHHTSSNKYSKDYTDRNCRHPDRNKDVRRCFFLCCLICGSTAKSHWWRICHSFGGLWRVSEKLPELEFPLEKLNVGRYIIVVRLSNFHSKRKLAEIALVFPSDWLFCREN